MFTFILGYNASKSLMAFSYILVWLRFVSFLAQKVISNCLASSKLSGIANSLIPLEPWQPEKRLIVNTMVSIKAASLYAPFTLLTLPSIRPPLSFCGTRGTALSAARISRLRPPSLPVYSPCRSRFRVSPVCRWIQGTGSHRLL